MIQSERYDGFAIILHWATAILVITLFGMAQAWGFLPRHGDASHLLQSLHVSLGITLAAVLFVRLTWRIGFGKQPASDQEGLVERMAKAMHYVLYGLLLVMVASGFGKIWSHQHAAGFFGLVSIPAPLAISRAWHPLVSTVHQWCAWTIIILAGLHALAALLHHYVLRDDILRRMLPSRRQSRAY